MLEVCFDLAVRDLNLRKMYYKKTMIIENFLFVITSCITPTRNTNNRHSSVCFVTFVRPFFEYITHFFHYTRVVSTREHPGIFTYTRDQIREAQINNTYSYW